MALYNTWIRMFLSVNRDLFYVLLSFPHRSPVATFPKKD